MTYQSSRTLAVNVLLPPARPGQAAPENPPLMTDEESAAVMRAFEPVVAAIEATAGPVEIIRPGVCALATRGPVRRLGGEVALADMVRAAVAGACPSGGRVGIADGCFAARLAAISQQIVPPGRTPSFLAPLPVTVLQSPDLVATLQQLGLYRLGDLAALPARDVVARFGEEGRIAHRLAHGREDRPVVTRTPPRDLTVTVELDPPADQAAPAAFAARRLAEELRTELRRRGLVCVRVAVGAQTEHGEEHLRRWRITDTGSIAERVRWQLDGWLSGAAAQRPTVGITRLWLTPEEVAPARGVQLCLWGETHELDERAGRAVARVQAMVGHAAVHIAVPSGGRSTGDQVRLVPFDEARLPLRPGLPGTATVTGPTGVELPPWPGRIPPPIPTVVPATPAPADLVDAAGQQVTVSGRGLVSAPPVRLAIDGGRWQQITAWAGPWPVDERWWDPAAHRRQARLQVVVADCDAHLLLCDRGRWLVAATYD